MKDWLVPIVVAIIAGVSGGGLAPLVQAFRGRKKAEVDNVATISEVSQDWVKEFKEETAAARRETAELRVELGRVRRESHMLADELRALRMEIMRPGVTIDGLRALVAQSGPPSQNGAGPV